MIFYLKFTYALSIQVLNLLRVLFTKFLTPGLARKFGNPFNDCGLPNSHINPGVKNFGE